MKRGKFSLSHYKLLTCDMGELIPISWFEALPGDTVQQASSLLVRVSPLLAPVMHPVHVRIHHWFVPNRLLWDDWESFITGGSDGLGDGAVWPYAETIGNNVPGTLVDYLGVPPGAPLGIFLSMLPVRAYNLIWNEWYRDQDLQAELPVSTAGGPASLATDSFELQNVSWEKDYFTSARPWAQKGPDVSMPLGTYAQVVPTGSAPTFKAGSESNYPTLTHRSGTPTPVVHLGASIAGGTDGEALKWHEPHLVADLANASAANINDLRMAFALQRYQEARARYGSRYTEYLRYLGVRSSDARLQRPEYLGGGKQTIQFSEVLQTGPGTDDSGVADLKGHGIGAVRSNRYRRFFEEHGIVMSLMSVRPKTMYTQGIHRAWTRSAKEDYFQRELQHVGQQEVLNREVDVMNPAPAGIFGYQDRYDEYRRMESSIAGDFRDKLDHWHYARIFGSPPVLNSDFVSAVPTKRVNAVQTDDVLWVMARHSIQARRMIASVGSSHIF